jgi:hypothetical protein
MRRDLLALRAEPWVLTMPPVPGDHYATFQWFDLYTDNVAYVGVLSTGRAGGRFLFAGPGWAGDVPDGMDGVFRSETELVGCLGRTGLDGPDESDSMHATHSSIGLFGSRAALGEDYLRRATAATMGIYGNDVEEAVYIGWIADEDGEPLVGDGCYVIRFPADALPPVRLFWSITMYALPSRLLVANPIDRYSIGDRTPGLTYEDDGALTLTVQHETPGRQANWLPAPAGPFTAIFRLYGPEPSVVDGSWHQPPMRRAQDAPCPR